MDIKIATLTPIWTGNVRGEMDRVRESGILGSLRWWYEAILRGLGVSACDPTHTECRFDEKKYRKSDSEDQRQRLRDAGICDACQLFGATGWRRRFRLEVVDDKTTPIWNPSDNLVNIRPPGRKRGWYLVPGHMGDFTIRLEGDNQNTRVIAALFLFLEKWGSLGAKAQLGYGLFKIRNGNEVREQVRDFSWKHHASKQQVSQRLPALSEFFFFSYHFKPKEPDWWTQVPGLSSVAKRVQAWLSSRHMVVPVTPALRNEWRYKLWKKKWSGRSQVFGYVWTKKTDTRQETERMRSRIAASWAYETDRGEWIVRGWAWQPSESILASRLWNVVRNEEGWQNAITETGRLHTYPDQNTWNAWNERDLLKHLAAAGQS